MFDNPLIRRYRYSLMRPRQFWIYMAIYIALLIMLFFINYTGFKHGLMYKTFDALCRSIYYQLLVIQVLVLWVWGSFNASSAIKEEVFEKTYDFFRVLPIPARAKAVGILVGKNLIVLVLAAINLVLLLLFGLIGEVKTILLGQVVLVLACAAILANSVALLSSINPKGKRKKGSIVGFILLAFFLGPMIINGLIEFAKVKNIETTMARFFELKLPIMVLTSLVVLYFSCWSIKGILRKFTREDEPLFTRFGALLFMVGYEFVLFGLFYPYLSDISHYPELGARAVNCTYRLISLFAVLAVPLASVRSFDRYLELGGLVRKRTGRRMGMLRQLTHSNLSLALGLFAIWAAVAILTTHLAKLDTLYHLRVMAVFLSFYLFLILLVEVYVVVSPYAAKVRILLIFIVGVYAIFPLILGGLFDSDQLYLHSPFGYVIDMFGQADQDINAQVTVIAVNLLLCAVPLAVVLKRYRQVITARQKM